MIIPRKLDSTSKYIIIRFISLAISGFIQLLLPVFFIRNYGNATYGLWILIFSLGSILSACDFGWVTSLSVGAIHKRVSLSNLEYQRYLSKISSVSIKQGWLAIIIGIISLFAVQYFQLFNFTKSSLAVCVASILYSVFSIRMKGMEAIFRANGSTLGFSLLTANHLINSLITLFCVFFRFEISTISILIATSSYILFVFTSKKCKSHLQHHKITLEKSRRAISTESGWGNALGFFSFPLSYLVLNEGMNILVATTLGTASLGTFALIRTYVGLFRQVTTLFTDSYSPAFAEYLTCQKYNLAQITFSKMCRIIYFTNSIILVAAVILIEATSFLSTQSIIIPKSLFLIFCASAIADVPWNIYFMIPSAANQLNRLAIRFITGCVLTIPIGVLLVHTNGLFGAAIALCVPDIFMTLKTRHLAQTILRKGC